MRKAVVVVLMIALMGCASVDRRVPAYPARGQTMEQVQADQAHCRTWAEHNASEIGGSMVGGAATGAVILGGVGAAFGAVLYALMGLNAGEGAVVGASLGALTGAVQGAGSSGEAAAVQQQKAYAACMATRGYTVMP